MKSKCLAMYPGVYNPTIMTGVVSTSDIRPRVMPNLIQRLCPDILAEIFTFCLPEVSEDSWRVEQISNRKAPLLLCSVCYSWRTIAISTPRLWQTLHFRMTSNEKSTDADSMISGVRTWLDRSGTLPLSIRAIFWVEVYGSVKATKCRRILEVLFQEVSRWESFEIHDDGVWPGLAPPNFGTLPMLHTLDISGSTIVGVPFVAAPNLKRLGLFSLLPDTPFNSAIPWDQVVELAIGEEQSISMAVALIRHCPRLELLCLQVEENSEDLDEDGSPILVRPPIQHNVLRRLDIEMQPCIHAVIDHLTLQALTDLSLWTRYSMPVLAIESHCSQFLDFLTRSNCELQKLALYHSELRPEDLLKWLSHQSCQTITHLVIQSDEFLPPLVNRELLIRLTYSIADGGVLPLCPKLVHLELNNCYSSNTDQLGKMVQSRCFGQARDAKLKSLRLGTHYAISNEDYKLLQLAKNEGGLELRYHYLRSKP